MRVTIRCQVWWARPAVQTPRLVALLDEVERGRHDAYHRAVDRARFLTGRVVAKSVVAEALGVPAESVRLDSTCADCGRPHGKPKVVQPLGDPPPEISISHSGDLVGVALTSGLPVGVDVEQERDVQIDGLIRMTLSPQETDAFDLVPDPDRDAAFFTIWSRKEALLKATGRGLSIPMTKVTLTPWTEPPAVLASATSEVDPKAFRMAALNAGSGYRACVAVVVGPGFPDGDWVSEHDGDAVVAERS